MLYHYGWLVPLGFIIGAYGTLIGAGGGFVLVPLLLLAYPKESPEIITSISLAVVFFNATSGSLAYARMKRIEYRSGIIFSLATIPGAILGAMTTAYMPRRLFDLVFGVLMIVASVYLLFHPGGEIDISEPQENLKANSHFHSTRNLVDSQGISYGFSYNPLIGIGLSLVVGYVSSVLGVGGGFIHVPALVHLLNFPVHIATATSHFILAIMALTGTLVHVAMGTFAHGVRRTVALAIGVVLGAQLGAALSNRFHGDWIIRGLAVALAFVGIRILIAAF
ncbi:MAG: sulfite exporter TauE/SafE family protein [Deltaproteobacteria bacterium]|nr:sulfite exporter TauE/SafE family protein [Deltaproteobacteria bacterium]